MKKDFSNLQGALILADPSLRGSVFQETALLLTVHGPDTGTQGLVLNQPLGQHLRDIIKAPDLRPLAEVPVYSGGPVSPGELMLVGLRWNESAGKVESLPSLGIAGALKAKAAGWDIRAFVGYTGWSAGQLEAEFEQGSWMLSPHHPEALEGVAGPALWRTLMRRMGSIQALMADLPEDPSLN
jgi:putative transcriptional regulator